MKPRLLIFDWDGTLMDSVATIVGCLTVTVAELGLEPIPEEIIRGTIGLGLDDAMDALAPDSEPEERRRIVEAYRSHWFGGYNQRAATFPWVRETLDELSTAGYLLAVATGKGRKGLDRDLEVSGLGAHFHATRTGEETFPKPHPAMVLELLEELGAKAPEALVIGDSIHDLEMAKNAGIPALAVASGAHCRKELEAKNPIACLETAGELPGWLKG